MMTQIQVQVPDYFTLKHYKSLQYLQDIEDEIERKLMTVAVFTNRSYDDVMNWNVNSIVEITDKIEEVLSNIKPEFYPIIEWNGKLWGYSSMQNMSVGEYVDLDNLCKDTDANINEILAILFRPVTENNLQSSKFVTRSTFKSLKYEVFLWNRTRQKSIEISQKENFNHVESSTKFVSKGKKLNHFRRIAAYWVKCFFWQDSGIPIIEYRWRCFHGPIF